MEPCDKCGAPALTLWWLDPDEATDHREAGLTMCGHHRDAHAEALVDQHWALMVGQRETARA